MERASPLRDAPLQIHKICPTMIAINRNTALLCRWQGSGRVLLPLSMSASTKSARHGSSARQWAAATVERPSALRCALKWRTDGAGVDYAAAAALLALSADVCVV